MERMVRQPDWEPTHNHATAAPLGWSEPALEPALSSGPSPTVAPCQVGLPVVNSGVPDRIVASSDLSCCWVIASTAR